MNYNASQILYIDPLEHVRMRPGMYLGGTDKQALHQVVFELLGHMLNEVEVGRCDHIWLELRPNNELYLRDNSLGLPTDIFRDNMTQMEALFEYTFNIKASFEPNIYQAIRLHTMGLGVVRALSEKLVVENYHEGTLWRKTYSQGNTQTPLLRIRDAKSARTQGTHITFKPDYTIFEANDFEFNLIEKRAREFAFLHPAVTIELRDLRTQPTTEATLHYPQGLKTRLREISATYQPWHEPLHIRAEVYVPRKNQPNVTDKVGIEIALQFSDRPDYEVRSYVNTFETLGGTHVTGLQSGLVQGVNQSAQEFGKQVDVTWSDIAIGLTAIIALRHPDPIFENKAAVKFLNPNVFGVVTGLVFGALLQDHEGLMQRFMQEP